VKCKNFEANYGVKCDCLPFGTNTKALIYLARKEGPLTLANGMLHGVATSTISAVTFFSFYEAARKEVAKHTSNPVMIPFWSAFFARTVTTTLIFPFEYWKTVIQSTKRANKSSIFKIGRSFNAGFASLLTRDIVFACVNWILLENCRDKIKVFLNSDQVEGERGYQNKSVLLLSNFIAGGFAGAIGALVSIPFDVVKTRKQLHHKEYKNRSILSILQEVYEHEGKRGLFLGARQRVWKVTLQTAGIITLYELFMDMMRKGEIQRI
jgi:solute carrier family 25 protein 39/40